jgi:5-aminopentanamidase
MKIGYFQFAPLFGEKSHNVEKVTTTLEKSSARLIVLPELFDTGYFFTSRDEVREMAEEIPGGPTSRALEEFCRSKGLYLVAGMAERNGGALYNSAALFGPSGHMMTYRKIHLFQEEKLWFSPGNLPFETIDTGGARIGIMICFDWIFPEACRTLAILGAQVICHPSNLVLPLCPDAMVTRCLENKVFAITANRTGTETRNDKSLHYVGRSQVVDPQGRRLASSGEEEEKLVEVDIEPSQAEDKKILALNDLFKDRRPDFYNNAPN